MKFQCLLWSLCSLLTIVGTVHAVSLVDPADPDILYTGRWDDSNPSQPYSHWIGSSLIVRFEGTGIAATFSAGNTDYFRIIVDDDAASSTKIPAGSSTITHTLVSGLTDAVHKIEIVKETDVGTWTFSGFELDNGKSLASPPPRPPRKIVFYGDSNLAGYSLSSEQNESGRHLRGSYHGYAGITSRIFDAEYHNVSRSGATISGLNSFYNRVLYGSPNPTWDFNDFIADVVVVNIGANDVGKPKHRIKSDYHSLLDDLRAAHPNAHVVLYNGWGWDYDEPANYTYEVVVERTDPDLWYAIFPWLFEQWHGCEYDHGGMAQMLADYLSSVTGWSQNPADVMNGYGQNGDVANGSFEEEAPFGGYGWRYYTDTGVSRVHAPSDAVDGEYLLHLENGAPAHQPIPASDGETFTVTAWMRGDQDGDEVDITMDFRDQEMWTTPLQTATETHVLTRGWQQYSMTATAPTGTTNPVFHTRVTFTAGAGDAVDIDMVAMANVTGLADVEESPVTAYRLMASPNPFRSRVSFAFRLPRSAAVRLEVFDLTGRRIAILADRYHEAGEFVGTWDGREAGNRQVGAGIYFVRLVAGKFTESRRITLLR